MTIDIIALAKEAGFIISGGDIFASHLPQITGSIKRFANLLEAEIRKEYETEARIQNETIASQHTEIKALELAIDILPSVAYVNYLTEQNAKLMEAPGIKPVAIFKRMNKGGSGEFVAVSWNRPIEFVPDEGVFYIVKDAIKESGE